MLLPVRCVAISLQLLAGDVLHAAARVLWATGPEAASKAQPSYYSLATSVGY